MTAMAAGTTTYLGQSYEIGPDNVTTKYIFGNDLKIASSKSTGEVFFYHTDHLGSNNAVTDLNGALVELSEFTPFGSLSRHEGSVDSPHQFTGQRNDATTGLYFYNARYYDPQLGRFTSADTVVPGPGDPQALNRYSYSRNNPIILVDPSGHFFFIPFIIAAVQAVASAVVSVASAAIGAAATVGSAVAGAVGSLQPVLSALHYVNMGISAYNAVKTGNIGGFVGGLVGGAAFGFAGQHFAVGLASSFGKGAFSFVGGAISGAAEFAIGGFGAGFGAALGSGQSARDSFRVGGRGAAFGAVAGAAIQGSYMAGWQNELHGYSAGAVAGKLGYDPGIQDLANASPRFRSRFRNTEVYRHYSYADEAASLAGGLRPGSFGTTDVYTSGTEAQQKLALPPHRPGDLPPDAYYNVIVDAGKATRLPPAESKYYPPSAYAPHGAYRTGGGSQVIFGGGTPPGSVIYGGALLD
jgi:RHS repeat-associated protein